MANHGDKTARCVGESRPRRLCALEGLESRCLLSATPVPAKNFAATLATPANVLDAATTSLVSGNTKLQGLTPQQVLTAYGFDTAAGSLGTAGGNGSGQTIAIVEAWNDPTIAADLHVFDQQFGLADPPSLTQVNQSGRAALPGDSSTWSQETALDVEWAHAISPGANIVIVEADSDGVSDLLTAVEAARNLPQVSVVSMSWGVDEFPAETTLDGIFTTPPGHQGITFVASSGEAQTASGVQWPAASPNVLSVGGSSLQTSADGSTSEAYWPNSLGGASKYEVQPTYETGPQDVPIATDSKRVIPDVVYNAGLNVGYAVYDSRAGWKAIGGTSAGAPQWGALIAIANQARAGKGLATLDGISQTLPDLYQFNQSNNPAINTATPGNALALTTSTGAQTLAVIGQLESTTVYIVPATPAARNVAALQLLAKKQAKAFYYVLARLPAPSLLTFATAASSHLNDATRAVMANTISMTGAVGTQSFTLSSNDGGSLSGAIAGALVGNGVFETATAAAVPPAALFAQTFAALFAPPAGTIAADDVVPVGSDSNGRPMVSPTRYYIAHLNIAGTFSDAIGAFINECAAGPRTVATADAPTNGHARAWTITAAILTLDVLAAGHLTARRLRRQPSAGYVQWWREPVRTREDE